MIYTNETCDITVEVESEFQEQYKQPLRDEWYDWSYLPRGYEYSASLYYTPLEETDIVLDVGCACSYFVFYIAGKVRKAYGIDDFSAVPWSERWRQTLEHFDELQQDKVEIVEHDAGELPFPDAFFDKVYTFSALEHFDWDSGADVDCAKEVYRVLKSGGTFTGTVDYNPLSEHPPSHPGTKVYTYQSFVDKIVHPAGFMLAGDVDMKPWPIVANYVTPLYFKLVKP
jgi:ubiquinone/menaquinone biosynthesis C-methylase UbiE